MIMTIMIIIMIMIIMIMIIMITTTIIIIIIITTTMIITIMLILLTMIISIIMIINISILTIIMTIIIIIMIMMMIIIIIRSISEISSCFFGPRPWHIEIRHRVKKTSKINLFGFETLKLKSRRLKLWKPTVIRQIMDQFQRFDRNGDGVIDRSELAQAPF